MGCFCTIRGPSTVAVHGARCPFHGNPGPVPEFEQNRLQKNDWVEILRRVCYKDALACCQITVISGCCDRLLQQQCR